MLAVSIITSGFSSPTTAIFVMFPSTFKISTLKLIVVSAFSGTSIVVPSINLLAIS